MNAEALDFGVVTSALTEAGLFPSLCTIERKNLQQNAIGEPEDQSPPSVTVVHLNVPCMIGVNTSIFNQAGTERRSERLTTDREMRQVTLNGEYAGIEADMAAIVDGVEYNILSIVQLSQSHLTELLVERVQR